MTTTPTSTPQAQTTLEPKIANGNTSAPAPPAATTATAQPTTAPAAPAPIVAATADGVIDEPSRALSAFSSENAFKGAYRMARAISFSSLVPKAYQGEEGIPNILIAMELANRIGASIFMVMQNLDVIQGRPGWRAQFLIATVNTSGRFSPLRFTWQGKPGDDDWGCRCTAKDRETGEICVGSLITIGLAKKEGWYTRNGSKWQTIPEQMLCYRAAAFWTRVYAPELSMGMQTKEEVIDTTGVELPDLPAAIAPGSTKALEEALMSANAPAPMPDHA